MTVFSNLLISGKPVGLISYDVNQELSAVGRATFVIDRAAVVGSLVNFDIGLGDKANRFSSYYVETSTPVGDGTFIIFCREFMEMLWTDQVIALRHTTARDVLNSIEAKSKIKIIKHAALYLDNEVPFFYSCKTLFHALQSMGRVFNIPRYCFVQYPNGSIWAGSLDDLNESKLLLNISEALLKPLPVPVPDVFKFTMVSGLRVGARLNGKVIKKLSVSNSEMVATCIAQ